MRNEALAKERILRIGKGNFIQMIITKLIKEKGLWVSFGINEHQTLLRVDVHEALGVALWFKMDLTKVFTLD